MLSLDAHSAPNKRGGKEAYLVQLLEEVSILLALPELVVCVGFLHAELAALLLALQTSQVL